MINKDPAQIQAMFGTIAKQYDRANGILSFQMHRLWNRRLLNSIGNVETLLDLCAGTGAIALGWLGRQPSPKKAYLLDFCPEMLAIAEKRGAGLPHTVHYLEADAACIPLPDQCVEAVSIAYGIRNVQETHACLHESFRVLKPGGSLHILELTEPTHPILKAGHTLYLKTLFPLMGYLFTPNPEAYDYLCRSIKAFIRPPVLAEALLKAGFTSVTITSLTGGTATLLKASKGVK